MKGEQRSTRVTRADHAADTVVHPPRQLSCTFGRKPMHDEIFPGQSEMARRMRELDWSRTPLGPVEKLAAVAAHVRQHLPRLRLPHRPLVGTASWRSFTTTSTARCSGPRSIRAALGQPGANVWAEIWDVIAPMLSQVMSAAKPTRSRDLLLHIDRRAIPRRRTSRSPTARFTPRTARSAACSARSSRRRRR